MVLNDQNFKYLNKEEIYSKLIKIVEEKFERTTDLSIIYVVEDILCSDLVLEKEKVLYLVNKGTMENATIFDQEKLKRLKNELISLAKTTLKYELKLINKDEFKVKSSNIFYNILRFENIIKIENITNFNETIIDRVSGTKENAKRIKKELKKWIKDSESAKILKKQFINEWDENDYMDFIYLFDEEEVSLYKSKKIEELDRRIEYIKSNCYTKDRTDYAKDLLEDIKDEYNQLININSGKEE